MINQQTFSISSQRGGFSLKYCNDLSLPCPNLNDNKQVLKHKHIVQIYVSSSNNDNNDDDNENGSNNNDNLLLESAM